MDETTRPMPGGGMVWMRAVLVGLGALLGVALLANGNVVIGGLLLVMAVLRGVMVLRFHQRRGWRQERRQAFIAQRRQRSASTQGLGDIDR